MVKVAIHKANVFEYKKMYFVALYSVIEVTP